MVSEEIGNSNKELKKELWERGYYVSEVGSGTVDYLVVTTAPPPLQFPITETTGHISN